MPQLDPMLRALVEKGARELVLASGRRPAFVFEDGARPVSRVVLQREQILALLRELAGPDTFARWTDGNGAMECTGPEGWRFRCLAEGENGSFVARIVPQNGSRQDAGGLPEPAPAAEPDPEAQTAPPLGVGTSSTMDLLLRELVSRGASDLHLSTGERPMLRLHGDMVRIDGHRELTPEDTERLTGEILPARNREEFSETGDTDFAHEIPGVSRFRVNVFRDRRGVGAVIRVIPTEILSAAQLGLPKAVLDLCMLRKGLVVVTGPTGSGKSTTLAAMIDHLNEHRSDHIITIEDPIEFVHPNKGCLVNQREVGIHTRGFKRALRAALREDPDVVLVGEMRDLETIEIAIETAETGHLVFGTLHTTTAASTVDRVIDQFPADRQDQIRAMLSESLKGVIAQTLLRRIAGGRVAAMEILIGIPAIANLIREGKTFQIPSIMQTGKKHGMMLLNDALLELVKSKQVAPEEAYAKATDKSGLAGMLRGSGFVLPPSNS